MRNAGGKWANFYLQLGTGQAITKKREARDQNLFQYVFTDRSLPAVVHIGRKEFYSKETSKHCQKKMRKLRIPVRRAQGASDPCPESHRRLARRIPSSSSDQNPPLLTINIVLTLQQGVGLITGNHRLNRWVPMLRRSSARRQ